MSATIEILPFSDTLDVYGSPNLSSAYSLSGHICISLKPSFSLFGGRRASTLILRSLELTFEGQTEVVSPSIGYSAVRLCRISRQLITGEGIELSNEGHEHSNEPCRWNVVFNLPLPGWLPESSKFGDSKTGVRYALYAKANIMTVDDVAESSWFGAICSPFTSKAWTVHTRKAIAIRRYIEAPSLEEVEVPMASYFVKCRVLSPPSDPTASPIPPEVLEKIQIVAATPSYIDVNARNFSLSLRLRSEGLADDDCQRICLSKLSVDLLQEDSCRDVPSEEYTEQFMLPDDSLQPPVLPLRDPHPLSDPFLTGFLPAFHTQGGHDERTFSISPRGQPGVYQLKDDNYIFANDNLESESRTWYTMETKVPYLHTAEAQSDEPIEWAGKAKLRPTHRGPLFSVKHNIRISMAFTYDLPDFPGQQASENIEFSLPLTVARIAKPLTSPSWSSEPEMTSLSKAAYIPHSLPVYSQLFYSNGDRKMDPTPLPLYSPRETHHVDLSQPIPYSKLFYEREDPLEPSDETTALLP